MNLISNRKYVFRIDGVTFLGTAVQHDTPGFIAFIDFRRYQEPERKVLPPCEIQKTVVYVNINKIEMIAELPCN